MIIMTIAAIIVAEILAYVITKSFSVPYLPSTPGVTFGVALLTTPFISWALLKLLFELDEMEKKMYFLATYDSMSMLLRREAFFRDATRVHSVAKQHALPYSIAIIDIDNFKSINDTHGHNGGDRVIEHFGQILRDLFSIDNPIGRIGGEEFALLIPVDNEKMEKEMDRIHALLQETALEYNGNIIKYSVSIGIFGNLSPKKISLDDALSYADKALYSAKHTGKKKSVTCCEKDIAEDETFDKILRYTSNLRNRKY